MDAEHHLGAGGEAVLALEEGTELFCAAGRLRLVPLDGWLPPQALGVGQGWRAGQPMRVKLEVEGARPARYALAVLPKPAYAWAARSFMENCWSWAMPLSSARRHQA